jgi:hypothetical protein
MRQSTRAIGPWHDDVEVLRGDVLEPDTAGPTLAGTDVAYHHRRRRAAGRLSPVG